MNTTERKSFTPQQGKIYQLHTTNQGYKSLYRCTHADPDGAPVLQSIKSGWTLIAHGCGIYPDGSIDWDYSTGMWFEKI